MRLLKIYFFSILIIFQINVQAQDKSILDSLKHYTESHTPYQIGTYYSSILFLENLHPVLENDPPLIADTSLYKSICKEDKSCLVFIKDNYEIFSFSLSSIDTNRIEITKKVLTIESNNNILHTTILRAAGNIKSQVVNYFTIESTKGIGKRKSIHMLKPVYTFLAKGKESIKNISSKK